MRQLRHQTSARMHRAAVQAAVCWPAGCIPPHTSLLRASETLTLVSKGITSALRDTLQGGVSPHMSSQRWSGVRQLILLRTKRKAAEAALSSFMLASADGERARQQEEPTPVSTLVLNCFVDVIGQQVCCACAERVDGHVTGAILNLFFRMQHFHPSIMSIALAEFHRMLLLMQVISCHTARNSF
jgi:hypothetical protein